MKKNLILAILATAIVLVLGIYLWQRNENTTQTKKENGNTTQAQKDAIRQAQQYQPESPCLQVLTPAVHKATGAKYTFRDSCLAPGWESVR